MSRTAAPKANAAALLREGTRMSRTAAPKANAAALLREGTRMRRTAAPKANAAALLRAATPVMRVLATLATTGLALGLCGCSLLKEAPPQQARLPDAPAAASNDGPSAKVPTVRLITAQTPAVRAYRKVGAAHIYQTYPKRIYKGKIPPLVYAVVVTETDVDSSGRVTGVYFSRTPSHAPEVSGMIAELIKAASPLPSPGALGAHTYVETWLWDKSGQFQLDSLTLGQRSR
jgi:periplasmic protein TonB